MSELRHASELRKEYDDGEDKAFKNALSLTVEAINKAHDDGEITCDLTSILNNSNIRIRIEKILSSKGYSFYYNSAYRDTICTVSW